MKKTILVLMVLMMLPVAFAQMMPSEPQAEEYVDIDTQDDVPEVTNYATGGGGMICEVWEESAQEIVGTTLYMKQRMKQSICNEWIPAGVYFNEDFEGTLYNKQLQKQLNSVSSL